MNVASALLEGIKARGLDTLFQMEEAGYTRQIKPALLEAIGKEAKGSAEDKLRLLVCLYLASTDGAIAKDDLVEYERTLKEAGADMAAWEYVKKSVDRHRAVLLLTLECTGSAPSPACPPLRRRSRPQRPCRAPAAISCEASARSAIGCVSSPQSMKTASETAAQLTDRLKEGGLAGVGTGFDNLISGVKNFLPAKTAGGTVARLVEALMDPASASAAALQATDDYLSFDPRAGRAARPGAPGGRPGTGQQRIAYSEAVVFVVGGGGYVEYTELLELAAQPGSAGSGGRKITYGSTEIMAPSDFVAALASLGRS
jgi:hypothetical protein